jgi:Uma2 family endonuclease
MVANPKDPPRHFYSLEEYFALEHAGDARYEYWNGDIVCMSGGSRAHSRISRNAVYRMSQRLEGGPCVAFTADLPVKTPSLLPYRYPDVTVGCGDLEYQNIRGVDALINPVLIVEVMSPTTARHDQEDKFAAYQVIASFREYLLITQDAPHVSHCVRQSDGRWVREDSSQLEAVLRLESIGCELPLREIYEGVSFDPT